MIADNARQAVNLASGTGNVVQGNSIYGNAPIVISLTGNGATHVLKLRRLRWPIFSDLTLMALTTVSRDDPLWRQ